jgi:cytochrome c6
MLDFEIHGRNSVSGAPAAVRRLGWLVGPLLATAFTVWTATVQAADPMVGKKIYVQHCQNCHGERGVPQWPGVPDFSHGEGLLQADSVLLTTIKAGKAMMPSYRGALQDDEIMDVIAYLRTLR